MKEYTCQICNFKSNLKSNYKRHLNTKKHQNKEKELGNDLGKKNKNPHKSAQILTNSPPNPHKSAQILTNSIKKYTCEYCGKNFKRSDNLYRHTNKYCKMNKMKQKEKMLIQQLEKNEKEHKEEKQKLYDYIDKLIEKTGDTYNIEQQNNQINLNNFGQEDVSHITDKFMQRLLSIPYAGVQKLIEKVHFNKKKPENKNIALTNKKEKMIKIFKNNKWKYKNREEIMDEIINTNYTRMDDFYMEKGKETLKDTHNNKYLEFQEKFEDQDKDLHEKIFQECEMILLSDNL